VVHVEGGDAVAKRTERMPQAAGVGATRDEAEDLAARRDEVVPADVLLDPRTERRGLHGGIVRRAKCPYAEVMGADTYEVQTSAGALDVEFGWDGWVAITGPNSTGETYTARRLVSDTWDLADLLTSFGLGERQAETAANRLWTARTGESADEEAPVARFSLGPFELAAGLAAAGGVIALVLSLV
jgi:hypothetical protein